ncbi:glycosyltransferase family 4 protein [Corynebacterium mayonis]|uniref:glycosyltransferase family 4 protein n=1 Tax=Corynebacterium mayonis TaxID=3062461 RepID=UPI0031400616
MTVLLVSNDFPPTVGGIQSYLRDFCTELVRRIDPEKLIVLTSIQNEAQARAEDSQVPFRVVRRPEKTLLPTLAVRQHMQRLIRDHNVECVWFGAAAPLALMGSAAREAGARRVVASTHGHEVGWSMIPGARQVLRRIGNSCDAITYISEYTLNRFRSAFGAHPNYVKLPSGVDCQFFRPAPPAEVESTRARLGVGQAPLIVCASRLVPRKGQDTLIRTLGDVRAAVPDTRLVIVGSGPYERTLRAMASGLSGAVSFTGRVSRTALRETIAAADVFAMPARTRGAGLDVEGLGIVYLEAQACGVPVIAGDSGGAPEAVGAGAGIVVAGRNTRAVEEGLISLLSNPRARAEMSTTAREFVQENYSWEELGDRLYWTLFPQG